ncbi:MAG TPA: DUF4398 domain-containing protein [Steroidobacteraceae bacterium]|nr:DUF4398 domain-containing protein [Steroidobacteraceae bacterium]
MGRYRVSTLQAAALCSVLGAVGCASAPPAPLTDLALARTAIDQAEHAGAARTAPEELSSARQRLSDAERLQRSDPDMARTRAREAQSDAHLAQAIAEDARTQVALSLARR